MTHVESDDDLDLGQDEEVQPTFEQELSRMNLRRLQVEAKDRGLSGAGSTAELIARISAYEETGGVIPDPAAQAGAALKSGIAPAPPEPTQAPAAPMQPAAGEVNSASAPAAGDPAKPRSRQRAGFFPDMNTYRVETPIGGPLGSTEPPDDNAHMRLIQEAHEVARKAGYHTRGFPHAGKRIGFASLQIPGQGRMRTVIYEVFAREED